MALICKPTNPGPYLLYLGCLLQDINFKAAFLYLIIPGPGARQPEA